MLPSCVFKAALLTTTGNCVGKDGALQLDAAVQLSADLFSLHVQSLLFEAAALCHAGGVIGRDRAPAGSKRVEVSFSHNDLLYATSFPTARFGMGAFAIALETLYQKVSQCILILSALQHPCSTRCMTRLDVLFPSSAVCCYGTQGHQLPPHTEDATDALPQLTGKLRCIYLQVPDDVKLPQYLLNLSRC